MLNIGMQGWGGKESLVERVGIVFHGLRHARTSKWIQMGFSDEIIRRATGHRSLAAYQNYVELDPHAMMRLVQEDEKMKVVKKRCKGPANP